jgi:hypothetical protein
MVEIILGEKQAYKFWQWLGNISRKKIKGYHQHGRRCPNCLLWSWETNGYEEFWTDEVDLCVEYMTCKQCKYTSVWHCYGMLPVLAPKQPKRLVVP